MDKSAKLEVMHAYKFPESIKNCIGGLLKKQITVPQDLINNTAIEVEKVQ